MNFSILILFLDLGVNVSPRFHDRFLLQNVEAQLLGGRGLVELLVLPRCCGSDQAKVVQKSTFHGRVRVMALTESFLSR